MHPKQTPPCTPPPPPPAILGWLWDLVIEDAVSWTPQVCRHSFVVLPVPGSSWEGRQVWADAGLITLVNVDLSGFTESAGRTTAASCRRTSVWLGLMNCLVEQNYIMLVFFKRIWQVLKYAGWRYNLGCDMPHEGTERKRYCRLIKCYGPGYAGCLFMNSWYAQHLIIFVVFLGGGKETANPRTAVHSACSLRPWFEGQRNSGEVEVPCWSQPSKAGQSYRLLFRSLRRLLPGTLCSFSTRLLLSPRSGGSLTSDSRSQIIPPQSNTVLLDLSCRAALHCKNMFCSL